MDHDILQASTHAPRKFAWCFGLSLFLHVGVFGVLGSFQLFSQVSEPVKMVEVRLLEIQSVPTLARTPQVASTPEGMPAMKTVTPTRVNPLPTPLLRRTSFTELSQVSLRPDVPAIAQELPFSKTKVSHTKQAPLLDLMAQNALMAKDLLKVIPYSSSLPKLFRPPAQPALFSQQNPIAGIPHMASPVYEKTALDSFSDESRRSSSSRRILSMETPSGEGALEKRGARLAQSMPPVYPRVAREEGWEGIVVLRVRLHKDGNPEDVSVQKTSGHDVLDQAAIKAIYGWSFVTARDGNIPIPSLVDIPVRFDLTSG